MNIYLLTRKDDDYGYDDYIGFVAIAKDAKRAKLLSVNYASFGWVTINDIKAELLGVSKRKSEKIIFESYNAG